MKNLLHDQRKISRAILARGALFLDYDGTLTPLVSSADQAFLDPEVRGYLQVLSQALPLLAIVSGRALEDIKKRVALPHLVYVGNHGLEIEGRELQKKVVHPAFYSFKRRAKKQLEALLEKYEGAFLEDKKLTMTIHYRLVEPKFQIILRREVSDFLERFFAQVVLREGKKALEIRPRVNWDKGKAVAWILRKKSEAKLFPVYIGDDVTDEDAFLALSHKGITCQVGQKRGTAAQYYLASPGEVHQFLAFLVSAVRRET